MNTGQTLLTVAAFILLSAILRNFYAQLDNIGEDVASGQDGILGTSINTSYSEVASGLAFDATTDTTNILVTLGNINTLTAPASLGPETGEDSLFNFNDFDDFNNQVFDKTAGGSGRRYRTTFKVYYVDPANIASVSAVRTLVKRLDMKTWRTFPPIGLDRIDTVKMSITMGYFRFD